MERAISNHQEAIKLTPNNHADLPKWLNNLGIAYQNRFEEAGQLSDLTQAIYNQEKAIQLTSESYTFLPRWLIHLGNSYKNQFERSGSLVDLEKAIDYQKHAIKLTPKGSANLPLWMLNIGILYQQHFLYNGDQTAFNAAMSDFQYAATLHTGSLTACLLAATLWSQLSKSHSNLISPSQLLQSHECVIHLLSLIAGLEKTLQQRFKSLAQFSQLALAAAAAAISIDQTHKALEWIEQGRCIVWSQINQLRSPIEFLYTHYPSLSDHLSSLSTALENAESQDQNPYIIDRDSLDNKILWEKKAQYYLKISQERKELLSTIRSKSGFHDFLQPKQCFELLNELPNNSLVIIIVAHPDSCDALALLSQAEKPIHIPLPNFSYTQATKIAKNIHGYLNQQNVRMRYSSADFCGARPSNISSSDQSESILSILLSDVWKNPVKPILDSLAFLVSINYIVI